MTPSKAAIEVVRKLEEMGAPKDAEIVRLREQLRLCNADQVNAETQIAALQAEIADLRTTRDHIEKQLNKDLSELRVENERLKNVNH